MLICILLLSRFLRCLLVLVFPRWFLLPVPVQVMAWRCVESDAKLYSFKHTLINIAPRVFEAVSVPQTEHRAALRQRWQAFNHDVADTWLSAL